MNEQLQAELVKMLQTGTSTETWNFLISEYARYHLNKAIVLFAISIAAAILVRLIAKSIDMSKLEQVELLSIGKLCCVIGLLIIGIGFFVDGVGNIISGMSPVGSLISHLAK